MTDGKITRFFLLLQTAHHMAAFERAGNQHCQFSTIHTGADFAPSLPLLGDCLHTVKPRTEGLASFRSQLWIAVVTIDGRVQQRAASRNHSGSPVSEIPYDLLEAVNRIRNLLYAFKAPVHCEFPGIVEGVSREFLLALEMPVDSALFQSSCAHEIRKRSAVVSSLIEDRSCPTNDFLPGLLAFTHIPAPSRANSAIILSLTVTIQVLG